MVPTSSPAILTSNYAGLEVRIILALVMSQFDPSTRSQPPYFLSVKVLIGVYSYEDHVLQVSEDGMASKMQKRNQV